MIFDSRYKAQEWFLNYKKLLVKVPSFWLDYDFHDWKFGDWILFQHVKPDYNNLKENSLISRPILGLFCGFSIWDQALVINYVQKERAWMYSHECIWNKENNYTDLIGRLDPIVEHIQFWTDNINVLGHYKRKPIIKELKESLKNEI